MKHWSALLAVVIATALPSPALAQDYRVGDLHIGQAWARATAGMAKNGAAYMTISNRGRERDRLVAVAAPVAKKVELHTLLMEGGVMKMRPVEAIEVRPGESSVLQPGGLHVMLLGLKRPLREGETFPMTLTFEKAGTVAIQLVVKKAGALPEQRQREK